MAYERLKVKSKLSKSQAIWVVYLTNFKEICNLRGHKSEIFAGPLVKVLTEETDFTHSLSRPAL